jgi:hypothetical protein
MDLVVTGGSVYWTNAYDAGCLIGSTNCGAVLTAPVDSAGVDGTVLWVGPGVDRPNYLATNGSSLGFTCEGSNASVATMGLNGGAQEVVYFSSSTVGTTPFGCAMNGTTVFWGDLLLHGIYSSPIGGCATPTQLVTGVPDALAVDADHLYWSDAMAGAIFRSDLQGQHAAQLASGIGTVAFLTLDATNLYFADNRKGTVSQVPVTGGSVTTLFSKSTATPQGVAVDAHDVYWSDSGGTIQRVPIGGGTVVTIADGQACPVALATDKDAVYWANQGCGALGTIMRLPK